MAHTVAQCCVIEWSMDQFKEGLFFAGADQTNSLANTKHLFNICTTSTQCLRRWSSIVQMLYKCFVFAGITPVSVTPHEQIVARKRRIHHSGGRGRYEGWGIWCLWGNRMDGERGWIRRLADPWWLMGVHAHCNTTCAIIHKWFIHPLVTSLHTSLIHTTSGD